MAAGFMRTHGGDSVEVFSAGSEPAASLNPAAVEAMREVGIDIAAQIPRRWSEELIALVDVVVTMGCGDTCPYVPGTRYVDWEIEDPAGKDLDLVRPIRDELERRVKALLAELVAGPAQPA
jgi:protein-tyrosine-phosphatase